MACILARQVTHSGFLPTLQKVHIRRSSHVKSIQGLRSTHNKHKQTTHILEWPILLPAQGTPVR